MLAFTLKDLLTAWLLPPVSLFVLAAAGVLISARRPRTGRSLALLGLLAGIALSMPLASQRLMAWLEAPYAQLDPPPLRVPQARQGPWLEKPDQAPQAIVLLAGGTLTDGTASTHPNRVSPLSLERALHARRVARLTGLPILIAGGAPLADAEPESRVIQRVLEDDLHVPAKWLETLSRDTAENAAFTAQILHPLGIRRVLLVTHAYHMRRAQWLFAREGFAVTPAPHSFLAGPTRYAWRKLVPTLDAIVNSRLALREMMGLAWYRVVSLFATGPTNGHLRSQRAQ